MTIASALATGAQLPSNTAQGIQTVLKKYGAYIDAYRGIIPKGVVAARVWHESRGDPKVYHSSTGEAGLLQLWPSTQQKYGVVDPYDPKQNLYGGLKHWNSELQNMIKAFPTLFGGRGFDFWAIAYLYTAIGSGGTAYLLKQAGARSGSEYTDVLTWLKRQGENYATSLGSQDPETVAKRVAAAGVWTKAGLAASGGLGLGFLAFLGAAGYYLYRKYWRR